MNDLDSDRSLRTNKERKRKKKINRGEYDKGKSKNFLL
jgi:hypothetical protein